MKKSIWITLLILAALLTACADPYVENRSFNSSTLYKAHIYGLPEPEAQTRSFTVDGETETVAFSCTKSEFTAYVQSVLEFLKAQENIYYLGAVDTALSILIILPQRASTVITDDFDISKDEYVFRYALANTLQDGIISGKSYPDGQSVEITLQFNERNDDYQALISISLAPEGVVYLDGSWEGMLE